MQDKSKHTVIKGLTRTYVGDKAREIEEEVARYSRSGCPPHYCFDCGNEFEAGDTSHDQHEQDICVNCLSDEEREALVLEEFSHLLPLALLARRHARLRPGERALVRSGPRLRWEVASSQTDDADPGRTLDRNRYPMPIENLIQKRGSSGLYLLFHWRFWWSVYDLARQARNPWEHKVEGEPDDPELLHQLPPERLGGRHVWAKNKLSRIFRALAAQPETPRPRTFKGERMAKRYRELLPTEGRKKALSKVADEFGVTPGAVEKAVSRLRKRGKS